MWFSKQYIIKHAPNNKGKIKQIVKPYWDELMQHSWSDEN